MVLGTFRIFRSYEVEQAVPEIRDDLNWWERRGRGETEFRGSPVAMVEFDDTFRLAGRHEGVLVIACPLDVLELLREAGDFHILVLCPRRLDLPVSGESDGDFPTGPVEEFLAVIGELGTEGLVGYLFEGGACGSVA